jgi:glucose/mannose transport system substrate-binding protein
MPRTPLRPRSFAFLAALCAALPSCATEPEATTGTNQMEIFSWWVSGSETDALDALLDVYADDHPGIEVINAAAIAAKDARQDLLTRMAEGFPPDTFQTNSGLDLLRWVQPDGETGAPSKLESLDELAEAGGWRTAMPEAVLERVMFEDAIYAVPVNVHRLNCLFYNVRVFEDAGLTPPTNLADFMTVSDQLEMQGITPLAVGANHPWTVGLLVWENLIPAMLGGQFYEDYLGGRLTAKDPAIVEAFGQIRGLFEHTNANAKDLSWDQAAVLVADGDAAMTFMGDWAKGEFTSRGLAPGTDFGMVVWGEDQFVFTMDAFVLPKGATNRDNGRDLLMTMGSEAGQDAFNPIKGSIPSRLDVDSSLYDSISQRSIADFRSPEAALIPARSMFVPQAFTDAVDIALGTFAADGNVDNLMITIDNNYAALH